MKKILANVLTIATTMATFWALIVVLALVLPGCVDTETITEPEATITESTLSSALVTVYQSITCSCCSKYVPYLKNKGFQVEVIYIEDRSSMWGEYQIPSNMQSCHTAVVKDYFVEGHVPIEAIEKLLDQRPPIDGIALPGMPAGSPGMSGSGTEALKIYALSDGSVAEFLTLPSASSAR